VILFDTSVLSRVLRRKKPGEDEHRLQETLESLMVQEDPLGLPAIVLQELLTGIHSEKQFEQLRSRLLASFQIIHPDTEDYIQAARLKNKCLTEGVNVSGPDCLIAAIAIRGEHELFAMDADFESIARAVPMRLFDPRKKR
jgi:predicted nucleic acid-binding protein